MYSKEMEMIECKNPNISRKLEHTDRNDGFGLCSSATTTKGLGVKFLIFHLQIHTRIHIPYLVGQVL